MYHVTWAHCRSRTDEVTILNAGVFICNIRSQSRIIESLLNFTGSPRRLRWTNRTVAVEAIERLKILQLRLKVILKRCYQREYGPLQRKEKWYTT